MKHDLSKEELKKITDLLKVHGTDYKMIATSVGVNMSVIYEVDVVHNKKFNYTPSGKGPVRLQKHIVAIRRVDNQEGWAMDFKIRRAHERYDRGEVEIVTGRDGMNLILYAIPRKVKEQRVYFTKEKVDV